MSSSAAGDGSTETAAAGRLEVDEPAPGVARLTIVNPRQRGALNEAILGAIASVLPTLEARCVLITGSGSMFSAGYNIADLDESGQQRLTQEAEKLVAHPFTAALDAILAYPYPTLAALNGHAIGGGLELAVCCDLRIAAAGITLAMPPAQLGLVYSHTGVRAFIDTIGAAWTRELFLGGRRIDADTALSWGLVGEIVPATGTDADDGSLAERAVAIAAHVAGLAPLAQRGNKRIITALLGAQDALSADLERELIGLRLESLASADFREGVTAFTEKRRARWQGR